MRRPFLPLVCLLALVAACDDLPTQPPADVDGPRFARSGGLPVVMVRSDAQAGGEGAVARTVADAVARVAADGLVRVFPGVHAVEDVLIDKPVRIESAGNGAAVLRNEATPFGLRVADGGALHLSGIELENAHTSGVTASVRVVGATSTVSIEDAAFRVEDGGFSGVYMSAGDPAATLSVERSSFVGGTYGLIAIVPAVTLRESAFEAQDNVSFYFTGEGAVESNTMTDCGDFACIYAIRGATGTIAGNTLSNARTGPGPVDEGAGIPPYAFFHHVILVFSGADVAITGNEIDGCGWGQCIATGVGAQALIEGNVITAYQAQGTRIGIVAGDGLGGASGNPDDASHATVRDNTFVGVADPITDRGDGNRYAFRVGGLLAEGVGSTLVAEGNSISSASRGLTARAAAALSGSGNTLDLVRVAAAIYDGDSSMDVHGSDFTDYVESIHQVDNAASSLTCNFWGSGGPTAVSIVNGQGGALYTPWSESPVAATGQTTGCTGGL